MSSSSLSTVVSSLVRASMGSSVSNTITDDDLDRTVAELILKEAKQKAERYLQDGVRAYLPQPDSNAPKPNKRFLSAIIRNTDDHNKAILKAQSEIAQELREEREEQERRERRARADEAADAERLRRMMGGSMRKDGTWSRDRDGKRRERSKERGERHSDEGCSPERSHRSKRRRSHSRSADYERERKSRRHVRDGSEDDSDRDSRRRRRSRSRSTSRQRSHRRHHRFHRSHRHRTEKDDEGEQSRSRVDDIKAAKQSKRSRSRSSSAGPSGLNTKSATPAAESTSLRIKSDSRQSSPQPKKPPRADLNEQFRSRKQKEKERERASPTLSEEEDIERLHARRKRATVFASSSSRTLATSHSHPPTPDTLPSKMDKYFEESYDPRLDHGPLTIPNVPSTGLLTGDEFEGWEAMLEVIRQRREDRAERKRAEQSGLSLEREKEKQKRKQDTWGGDVGESILDIRYTKKGAVREWDMGKEGF